MHTLISNDQAKAVIDAEQQYQALRDAREQLRKIKGGMHWKTISGKEYLYRTVGKTSRSLGPRSPDTEQLLQNFTQRHKELTERVELLKEHVSTAAKINVVYRAGHAPNQVADICLALDDAGLLEQNITIIGTNAMHAYEALAGARFPSDIMATTDVDLLWNHHSKLSVATTQTMEQGGLLALLKKADRTFEIDRTNPFRAVSARTRYMVDLIRQMPDPPWADEPDRFFQQNDLVATDIWNMKWMLGAPRVIVTAIALDGRPFRMAAPDPRAFAMFKLWLGTMCEDREPVKKKRDLDQADAVIRLVEDRMPHLARAWPQLKSFPQEMVERTVQRVERMRG